MDLQKYTYLFSSIIIGGTAFLVEYKRNRKLLKKYELVILTVIAIGIPYATTDYFALKWHAWFYSSTNTFNIHFGTELESFLFVAVFAFIASTVTLVGAYKIDHRKKSTKSSRSRRQPKPRLRKAYSAAVSARR